MERADLTSLAIEAQLCEPVTIETLCNGIGKTFVEIKEELLKLKNRKPRQTSQLNFYSRELTKSLQKLPVPEGKKYFFIDIS